MTDDLELLAQLSADRAARDDVLERRAIRDVLRVCGHHMTEHVDTLQSAAEYLTIRNVDSWAWAARRFRVPDDLLALAQVIGKSRVWSTLLDVCSGADAGVLVFTLGSRVGDYVIHTLPVRTYPADKYELRVCVNDVGATIVPWRAFVRDSLPLYANPGGG